MERANNPQKKRGTASLLLEKARELPVCLLPLSLNAYVEAPRKAPRADADDDAVVAAGCHALPSLVLSQHSDITEPSASARVHLRGALEGGGLRANTTLVVGGDSTTLYHTNYLQQWSYRTAALHALRGGSVVYVLAPGSSCFDERGYRLQMLQHLDSAVCAETTEALPATRGALQEVAMLAALGRTDVIQCRDAEDLYVFCSLYTTVQTVRGRTGAAGLVPLVVVEGGGRDSYLDCYERASGVEVPLAAWLTTLQRRLLCAVLVVEGGPSVVLPRDASEAPPAEVSLQQDRLVARFAQGGDERSGMALYYLHMEATLTALRDLGGAAAGEGEDGGPQPLCAVLPTGYLYLVRALQAVAAAASGTTTAASGSSYREDRDAKGAERQPQGHHRHPSAAAVSARGQLLVSSPLY